MTTSHMLPFVRNNDCVRGNWHAVARLEALGMLFGERNSLI